MKATKETILKYISIYICRILVTRTQEKDSSSSSISSRTDGKKKKKKQTLSWCTHGTTYAKHYVRTALPLDSQGYWCISIWSWEAMESWSPTSQYDDSLNVLPKIVKFTQEPSFTELLTCSSTVARLTAHSWSVTLSNLQTYTVSPCTENARRKTNSVLHKSYTLVLAKMVSPFFVNPVWIRYVCFFSILILLCLSTNLWYI